MFFVKWGRVGLFPQRFDNCPVNERRRDTIAPDQNVGPAK